MPNQFLADSKKKIPFFWAMCFLLCTYGKRKFLMAPTVNVKMQSKCADTHLPSSHFTVQIKQIDDYTASISESSVHRMFSSWVDFICLTCVMASSLTVLFFLQAHLQND